LDLINSNYDSDPFPVQNDPLMDLPTGSFHRESSHSDSSPNLAQVVPNTTHNNSPVHRTTTAALLAAKCSAPREAPLHRGELPDRAPTSSSLMSYTPYNNNAGGGEITIEKYRQQLEEYIENIENSNTNGTNHPNSAAGAAIGGNNNSSHNSNPAAHLACGASAATYDEDDEDDDDYASDLEDDWEKEREKNRQTEVVEQSSSNQNKNNGRGVNRHLSGYSFMSAKTTKSAISMVSGISASMFSTDFSTGTREQKMNAGGGGRSVCSNLSLMSELTDLSENIDKLGLDD
jgi:hypothetical protein